MSKAFDLDSLLDEALDDLDEHHVSGTPATSTSTSTSTSLPTATTTTTTSPSTSSSSSSSTTTTTTTTSTSNPSQSSISELTALLSQLRTRDDAQHLLGDLSDEKLMEFTTALAGLANMEQQGLLTPQTPTTTTTSTTSTSTSTSTTTSSPTDSIDQAVKMISEGAKNLPPGGLPGMNSEADLDQFLSKLMAEFEGSGGATGDEKNGDVDDMVEKMMGQMLSKECLYQPMKDIVDKYPSWLDEHKSTLSSTDYNNYIQQLTIFRKIITSFDTDPENTKVIFNLMQEMQAYGQPPKELIAGLLPPGMNMDEQGMPDFAAMAAAAGGPSALPPGFPPLGPNGMPDEAALKEFAKNECPTM